MSLPEIDVEALRVAAIREGLALKIDTDAVNPVVHDHPHGPEESVLATVPISTQYQDLMAVGQLSTQSGPATKRPVGFGAELDAMIERAVAEYRQRLVDGVREEMQAAIRRIGLAIEADGVGAAPATRPARAKRAKRATASADSTDGSASTADGPVDSDGEASDPLG